jgi:L-iditol 2-dehydrogenase
MYNLCTNMQEVGSTLDGGFAEYMHIPQETVQIGGLLPLPDSLGDDEASLIEPLACCLNGISQISHNGRSIYRRGSSNALQTDDKSVAIIGDGPIGLIHLQLFKNLLRTKPILIGKISERMDIARSLGAKRTFFSNNTDATVSEILQFSDSDGYDLVVVASSDPSALELATMIASKGSTISVFAGIKEKSAGNAATLDPNIIHYNQISVTGSFSSTPDNFKQAIQIATDKVVDLSKIVTRQCSLDRITDALFLTENYKGLRTAVIP